jgi:hypothetical protein
MMTKSDAKLCTSLTLLSDMLENIGEEHGAKTAIDARRRIEEMDRELYEERRKAH